MSDKQHSESDKNVNTEERNYLNGSETTANEGMLNTFIGNDNTSEVNTDDLENLNTSKTIIEPKSNAAKAAKIYLAQGFKVHPVHTRTKEPKRKEWGKFDAKPHELDKDFPDPSNIGVQLGSRSNDVADIDLDWPEARNFANDLLGNIPSFGRASSPRSHRIIRIGEGARDEIVQFSLPITKERAIEIGVISRETEDFEHVLCIAELRSSGHTVFPPGIHKSGEAIEWTNSGIADRTLPIYDRAHITNQVGLLAFLSLIVRLYPAKGNRQSFCMALSGALIDARFRADSEEHGYSEEEIEGYVELVARYAGDDEVNARKATARGTWNAHESGEPHTGLPRLCEIIGIKDLLPELRKWLYGGDDAIGNFNDEWALVEKPVAFYRFSTGTLYTDKQFNLLTEDIVYTYEKDGKAISKPFAPIWRKSSRKRKHAGMAFEPDEPEITKDNKINRFKGFPIEPKEGDATHFKDLVLHIADYNEGHARYLTGWMAHIIQRPAIKIRTAIFSMSHETGVGKSVLANHFGGLLGDYCARIGPDELESGFDSYSEAKLLVIVDENFNKDKRKVANKLKNRITETKRRVNRKYMEPYEINDCANWWFTSNESDALLQERKDRRLFSIRAKEEKRPCAAFAEWWQNGGDAYVMHYLKNYDLSGFDPFASAPMTEFKEGLIRDSQSTLQQEIYKLKEDCEGKPLRTTEQICEMKSTDQARDAHYQDFHKNKRFLATELRTAGSEDRRIDLPERVFIGTTLEKCKIVLWPVTDYTYWKKAPTSKWVEQYMKQERTMRARNFFPQE